MTTPQALAGLKVADFSHVVAGPLATHFLALNGHLDRGLRIRSMVLPDSFIQHDSPSKMYDEAGLNAPHIVAQVLAALGRDEAEAAIPPSRA